MTEPGDAAAPDARDALAKLGCQRGPGSNQHAAIGIVDIDGHTWRVTVTRAARLDPIKVRLARVLADMSEDGRVSATQHQLAMLVGASKQYTSQALHDLRDAGVLHPGYRYVTIIDPASLHRLGQEGRQ